MQLHFCNSSETAIVVMVVGTIYGACAFPSKYISQMVKKLQQSRAYMEPWHAVPRQVAMQYTAYLITTFVSES